MTISNDVGDTAACSSGRCIASSTISSNARRCSSAETPSKRSSRRPRDRHRGPAMVSGRAGHAATARVGGSSVVISRGVSTWPEWRGV
jgi:hypothetical protein